MCSRVRMFARVLIWRAVTAERDATRLARPQMNPVCTDLYAFGAFANFRLFNRFDSVEMRATAVRHCRISLFRVTNARNAVVDAMLSSMYVETEGEHLDATSHKV